METRFPNQRQGSFPGMLILKDIAGSFVNKPMRLNLFSVNKIREKGAKQTQGYQPTFYQQLTAIFTTILRKFVWIASALLQIRGCGPALVAAQAWEGLPAKPGCPLE